MGNQSSSNVGEKHFGFKTLALEVIEGVDLTGKVAIVTGGTSGIGVETVRALAYSGCHVILPCKNESVGKELVINMAEEASKSSDYNNVQLKIDVFGDFDLSSFESIENFAKKFKETRLPIHMLILNAGVSSAPGRTKEGFESTVGINHYGHFVLTTELLPTMAESASTMEAAARIVIIASAAQVSSFNPNHLEKNSNISSLASYHFSKSCNILFSVALQHKIDVLNGVKRDKEGNIVEGKESKPKANITVNSVHPGGIRTNIGRHTPKFFNVMMGIGSILGMIKTVEQGAATSIFAAVSPEMENKGGLYLVDCAVSNKVNGACMSLENAQKMWEISERVSEHDFPLT